MNKNFLIIVDICEGQFTCTNWMNGIFVARVCRHCNIVSTITVASEIEEPHA